MNNTDHQLARHNMVVQQIRPCNVNDEHLLGLLESVPRENFVPADCEGLAFADTEIPLGHGQCMMKPLVEANMLEALDVQPTETVLEIGTGSGFVTALLAKSARHVHSIEINPELSVAAAHNLEQLGIVNVSLEVGDACKDTANNGTYDVIAVTGSLPLLEERFQQSLKIGGRLFVIIGEAPAMEAVLITRVSENEWQHKSLFETNIAALQNAPAPQHFEF
ncbi:MAG: protein-L-isoaspartate O-methyltransferase [Sulfuriflexus sp.]|nr:protein-L-isoaspartate O-methyltransferase [Sulfuriflexus sp.]